jgi:hypothetical protein
MFYLTKRIDERQCTVGEKCMALSDFSGIYAGQKGVVTEIYYEGIMVKWLECENCAKGNNCGPAPKTDGFGRDELQYLAFATFAHPDFNPEVYREKI